VTDCTLITRDADGEITQPQKRKRIVLGAMLET
jgi:hypothetical protein